MQLRDIVPSWFMLDRLINDALREHSHDFRYRAPEKPVPFVHSGLRRAQNVKSAFHDALPIAHQMLRQRFADLNIDDVLSELLDIVAQTALIVAASMLTGATIGAAAGALAGGAGAVPGAIAGSAIGLKASGWILGVLGLSAIAEFFTSGLPEVFGYYWRGINKAVDISPHAHGCCTDTFAVPRAARVIAQGHLAMVTLLLGAIVAYLTRGRGRIEVLVGDMQGSARGMRLAQWMQKHEEALKKRFDGRSQGSQGSGRVDPPKEPQHKSRREYEPIRKRLVMPEHAVPCFNADRLPTKKIPEFDLQLGGQQGGLNDLTVEEYLKGRAAFRAGDVSRDPALAIRARQNLIIDLIQNMTADLKLRGMKDLEAAETARQQARQKMSVLAALHNPDSVAGGKDRISDFGDRQVNSSIGAQWRRRITSLDEAANNVDSAQQATVKINAKLSRCK